MLRCSTALGTQAFDQRGRIAFNRSLYCDGWQQFGDGGWASWIIHLKGGWYNGGCEITLRVSIWVDEEIVPPLQAGIEGWHQVWMGLKVAAEWMADRWMGTSQTWMGMGPTWMRRFCVWVCLSCIIATVFSP